MPNVATNGVLGGEQTGQAAGGRQPKPWRLHHAEQHHRNFIHCVASQGPREGCSKHVTAPPSFTFRQLTSPLPGSLRPATHQPNKASLTTGEDDDDRSAAETESDDRASCESDGISPLGAPRVREGLPFAQEDNWMPEKSRSRSSGSVGGKMLHACYPPPSHTLALCTPSALLLRTAATACLRASSREIWSAPRLSRPSKGGYKRASESDQLQHPFIMLHCMTSRCGPCGCG